ncbi:MAG TPA: LytTR family DNA-binding domain-containing protein [Mucilaginibacter sp.]|jgi:DNA-binding LytR/AlgR family response regulator|nr:LytTR family DNA-binding domain-containing protein [Mucilaginibacter sp.]
MMRCIIVDDEQLVRELLEDNLGQIPFLHLVTTCKNALEAATVLQTEKVDLIFLDVQMPGLNGLQFLQSMDSPPLVILVTAYERYAIEGFELNVVDYILKPYSFERLLKACNRASELFKLRQAQDASTHDDPFFFVNVEYTLVKIVVSDIEYIEGLKDYVKIHLSSSPKPVMTHMTIKALEQKLLPGAFVRTHKSFLVAASKITKIKRDSVFINEQEIPVSPFYKDNIAGLSKS